MCGLDDKGKGRAHANYQLSSPRKQGYSSQLELVAEWIPAFAGMTAGGCGVIGG